MENGQIKNLWHITPSQAIEVQKKLCKKVKIESLKGPIRTIGGADISFNLGSKVGYAAIIVIDQKTKCLVDQSFYVGSLEFPYIPGLLSFREIPLLIEAWRRLQIKPDLIVMDGQGIAHPRRFGIASHFGVLTHSPSLGCAKSLLVGHYQGLSNRVKSYSELVYRDEVVGFAYRTRGNVAPVFISPGHKMDLNDCLRIMDLIDSGYRIPEPTRQAHQFANAIRRELSEEMNAAAS